MRCTCMCHSVHRIVWMRFKPGDSRAFSLRSRGEANVMATDIFDRLKVLGFADKDLYLIQLCAMSSCLGSFVQIVIMYWRGFEALPSLETNVPRRLPWQVSLARVTWLTCRIVVVGAAPGVLLALSLVGALTEGVTVVSRVLAFAALLGFSAPRILSIQQRIVEEGVERILNAKLSEMGKLLDRKTGGAEAR